MRNFFLTVVLMFCFSLIWAQSSEDEKEVRKINQDYDEAIKNADMAFYERILAPGYVSYSSDGSVKNRTQVLEELKKQKASPTYRISKVGSEDVKVKLSGDLAVVTAKWNATTQSMEDDEPHEDTGHYVVVYEKNNGQWQITSEMGSEKPHTPEELEPSLKKTSNMYGEAMKNRDKESFTKLLSEDYSSTNPDGLVRTREQDIAFMFDPNLKLTSVSTEDQKFKVYRDFAVETGKYNVSGNYNGENFTESGRYTSTWRIKDGKWQLVADHNSRLKP